MTICDGRVIVGERNLKEKQVDVEWGAGNVSTVMYSVCSVPRANPNQALANAAVFSTKSGISVVRALSKCPPVPDIIPVLKYYIDNSKGEQELVAPQRKCNFLFQGRPKLKQHPRRRGRRGRDTRLCRRRRLDITNIAPVLAAHRDGLSIHVSNSVQNACLMKEDAGLTKHVKWWHHSHPFRHS